MIAAITAVDKHREFTWLDVRDVASLESIQHIFNSYDAFTSWIHLD
jgi:hypothetical protein